MTNQAPHAQVVVRDPIVFRLVITADDLEAMHPPRTSLAPPWYRKVGIGLNAVYAILIATWIGLVLARHERVDWWLMAWMFLALLNFLNYRWFERPMLGRLRVGDEFDFRFDDDGLTIGGRTSRSIPWRRVSRIRDADDAIVLTAGLGSSLIIPKRQLPDGGAALWAFFVDRLIGKRNLIRSAGPLRVIVPSAAR